MNDDDTSNTTTATPSVPESAERDLDRMLGLLAPPAPSETLRARLLRDFRSSNAHVGQGAAKTGGFARARFGAVAVAAALVLAVALGITVQPGDTPAPVATTAPFAPASLAATATLDAAAADDLFAAYEDEETLGEESDESSADAAERAFAEGAPDGTAFMLAALDLGLRANDPVSDDTGSFEGMPLE